MTSRVLFCQILILMSLPWLGGCGNVTVSTPETPLASTSPLALSSPLPTPQQQQPAPTLTPTLVSIPGVPQDIVYYAGVAQYLVPRLPTRAVLEQWNALKPPKALRVTHQEFASSMQNFMRAHQTFNDAAFGRSQVPLKQASDDLDVARESHIQSQAATKQALAQFIKDQYQIDLEDIPQIVVPLEP